MMGMRLLNELRGRNTEATVDAALASLFVIVDDSGATLTRRADPEGSGTPLFPVPPARTARIRIMPGVYLETPTSSARVRMLEAASTLADRVEVHAPTVSTGTHRGRVAIDLPRRAARALGLDLAEPGDRFDGRFAHVLFDDEAIIEEAARSGLGFVARRGSWVILERALPSTEEDAAPFAAELVRVLGVVREAERLRTGAPPERAAQTMRDRGARAPSRGPVGRARLRRAIGWVDAFHRGGPNCFRRTLAELGLDAGAARETLVFGLDVGRTGHVALKDSEDSAFDVAFEIPATK